MERKKSKVSFDAMIKFFIQQYNIPSKKDIDKILKKLDHLENMIKDFRLDRSIVNNHHGNHTPSSNTIDNDAKTATDIILNIIRQYPSGISFADIRSKTEFEEKKVRNILFRLDKMEKIQRKGRGVYIPS